MALGPFVIPCPIRTGVSFSRKESFIVLFILIHLFIYFLIAHLFGDIGDSTNALEAAKIHYCKHGYEYIISYLQLSEARPHHSELSREDDTTAL
jgi:hypothetical protein